MAEGVRSMETEHAGTSEDSPASDPNGPSDPNSMGVYFAPKQFRYNTAGSLLTENHHCVSVVAAGDKFLYVLPGFNVLAVEFRHLQIKGMGSVSDVFDIIVKNDASLSRSHPCEMLLEEATIIKVSNILHS